MVGILDERNVKNKYYFIHVQALTMFCSLGCSPAKGCKKTLFARKSNLFCEQVIEQCWMDAGASASIVFVWQEFVQDKFLLTSFGQTHTSPGDV